MILARIIFGKDMTGWPEGIFMKSFAGHDEFRP